MTLSNTERIRLGQALLSLYSKTLEEVRYKLEESEHQQYAALIGQAPADEGDMSVADELADFNVGIIHHEIRVLREIEEARTRLKTADFGTCVDCHGSIPFGRLLAYPTAERCVTCQSRHEKTYTHARMPTM